MVRHKENGNYCLHGAYHLHGHDPYYIVHMQHYTDRLYELPGRSARRSAAHSYLRQGPGACRVVFRALGVLCGAFAISRCPYAPWSIVLGPICSHQHRSRTHSVPTSFCCHHFRFLCRLLGWDGAVCLCPAGCGPQPCERKYVSCLTLPGPTTGMNTGSETAVSMSILRRSPA